MLKSIISDLKLFDMKVGENNETTNFDPKHLAKRMRNSLIGNSVKIGEKLVQPSDISKVLSASKSFDSKHKVQRLLNPDDKQNGGGGGHGPTCQAYFRKSGGRQNRENNESKGVLEDDRVGLYAKFPGTSD